MFDALHLTKAPKRYTLDQDKTLPPAETVRRFRQRLRGIDLDILAHTRRIDTGRLGIPVYFSTCGRDARALTGTRKQMGKGANVEQAEASAVMELAERVSLYRFMQNEGNFQRTSMARLTRPSLSLGQIARSVNDDSDEPRRLEAIVANLPLKWTWASDLTTQRRVLVPFDWFFTINQFNGASAGNCPAEAICQGICEVVERHVSARITHEARPLTAIDPATVTDATGADLIERYRRAGIRLYLSDFTYGMGIPSVGALAWDPATWPGSSEIVWTAGTATSPAKALNRTLTEVAQLAGDFTTSANYVASGLPKLDAPRQAAFVTEAPRRVPLDSLPDLSDRDIAAEVHHLVDALAEREYGVLVVDTTHPQLDIPAAYTMIPGTAFRERAAAGGVGLFTAKLLVQNLPVAEALEGLARMERCLSPRYYLYFYRGTCHQSREDHAAALDCFERALDLGPHPQDAPSIHSYMGAALSAMGRFERALEALTRGARLDSRRTDIHNLMGFCLFKLGRYERAIAAFENVLRLDPGSAVDYANIATNYRELGRTAEAIEYYRTALGIDPTIGFARENLERLTRCSEVGGR